MLISLKGLIKFTLSYAACGPELARPRGPIRTSFLSSICPSSLPPIFFKGAVTAGDCGPSCRKGKQGRGTKSSKTSSLSQVESGGHTRKGSQESGNQNRRGAGRKSEVKKRTSLTQRNKQEVLSNKDNLTGRHGGLYSQGGKTQVKLIGHQLRREKEQRGEVKLTTQRKTRLSK